jgi:acetolactate synthase-1/2/3 large subunit
VVVVGTPLDFRLGFGDFGGAEVVHLADSPEAAPPEGKAALQLVGDLAATLEALADAGGVMAAHRSAWLERLRAATARREASDQAYLEIDTEPIHPARLVAEIARALDADGVFVGDGGDCVSWAGRLVPSRRAGCWLDPGPYGCLGTGPGYLAAARLAHPDRQALLLAGDGALGFAAADLETLARHRLGGAVVVANNGTWGLEKNYNIKILFL